VKERENQEKMPGNEMAPDFREPEEGRVKVDRGKAKDKVFRGQMEQGTVVKLGDLSVKVKAEVQKGIRGDLLSYLQTDKGGKLRLHDGDRLKEKKTHGDESQMANGIIKRKKEKT